MTSTTYPRGRRRAWALRRPALAAAALLWASAALAAAATPALLRVALPGPGAVVGAGGVEVAVRFPDGDRIAPETVRVLLNGADVTGDVTTGQNGIYGRLYELLDGQNTLRFEVFGRRWWLPGVLVEEAREVRFLVRSPQDITRG